MNFGILVFIFPIALIHTVGEILYKQGSEDYIHIAPKAKGETIIDRLISNLGFFFQTKIMISLFISLSARVLFAIVLQFSSLSTLSAIYLGLVIFFSQFGGILAFKEKITNMQVTGVFLIISGVYLIGG